MDMDYMHFFRQPHANMNMQQPFHGQTMTTSHSHQLQYNQLRSSQLLAFYHQQQQDSNRAAQVMLNHHAQRQAAKHQNEPKPRLAKEEVDLLEREFAKNQKPNSSTKRELAGQMRVEVPRINNWFQNRRAKEKQIKKAREFEAQQTESKMTGNGDKEGEGSDEYEPGNRPSGLSTAAFSSLNDDLGANGEARGSESQARNWNSSDAEEAPASLDESPLSVMEEQNPSQEHSSDSYEDGSRTDDALGTRFTPNLGQTDFSRHQTYDFTPNRPSPQHDLVMGNLGSTGSQDGLLPDGDVFGSMANPDYFGMAQLPHFQAHPSPCDISQQTMTAEHPSHELLVQEPSPMSNSPSPPTARYLRFKSPPPPLDIATRRNMRRPAPLGISSWRSASLCQGIRTGMDGTRRPDNTPMRRIASATGMNNRIRKPYMTAPRSPFALDRNRDTPLHGLQQKARSPIMSALSAALSPNTPETLNGTWSSTSDDDQGYTFASNELSKTDQSIKTPPGTPCLMLNVPESLFGNHMSQPWNLATHTQDDSLSTSSLGSHGSELDLCMAPQQLPSYVCSQPVTPSFPAPTMGPAYSSFFGSGLTGVEYTFPDSYLFEIARSSPGQIKFKQFQFAPNITPQDFGPLDK